jgi:EAL domain-containing protein (putative c-di-GMP-specific phosphodiesterase class I)
LLAHALDVTLVAEGAEDQATVDPLTLLGCDDVQGYCLSRPLPPDQLLDLLHQRSAADQRA